MRTTFTIELNEFADKINLNADGQENRIDLRRFKKLSPISLSSGIDKEIYPIYSEFVGKSEIVDELCRREIGSVNIESGCLATEEEGYYEKMKMQLDRQIILKDGKIIPPICIEMAILDTKDCFFLERRDFVYKHGFIRTYVDVRHSLPTEWFIKMRIKSNKNCIDAIQEEESKKERMLSIYANIGTCYDECTGLAAITLAAYKGAQKLINRL